MWNLAEKNSFSLLRLLIGFFLRVENSPSSFVKGATRIRRPDPVSGDLHDVIRSTHKL
jgi:hypothetical protein